MTDTRACHVHSCACPTCLPEETFYCVACDEVEVGVEGETCAHCLAAEEEE